MLVIVERIVVAVYNSLTDVDKCIGFVNTPRKLFPFSNLLDAESWFSWESSVNHCGTSKYCLQVPA